LLFGNLVLRGGEPTGPIQGSKREKRMEDYPFKPITLEKGGGYEGV
jgi:hypothetical protein